MVDNSSTWKTLLSFSIPLTFIGLVEYILIFTDLIWVKVFLGNNDALASIRVSASILMVIEAIVTGVLAAIVIYIGHNIDRDKEQVKLGFKNGISIALYAGIGISVIGYFLQPYLGVLFGINAATKSYISEYLTIYFIGYVIITINSFLIVVPRYFYNLKLIIYALCMEIGINATLTPIIILTFNDLSVLTAAALGTIIAHLISSVYLIIKIYHFDVLNLNFNLKEFPLGFHFSILKKQFGFVTSQVFNGLTLSISSFIFLIILSFYPNSIFNVYSVGSYIFIIFGAIGQNFAASLIPLIAREYGKLNFESIDEIVKKSLIILLGFGGIIAVLLMFSSKVISRLIADNVLESKLLTLFLLIYSIPWAFQLLSTVFIFVAAGTGHAKGSFYLIISNTYVIGLLPILFLPRMFTDINMGVIITLAIIEILTLLNSAIYYLRRGWKRVPESEHELMGSSGV